MKLRLEIFVSEAQQVVVKALLAERGSMIFKVLGDRQADVVRQLAIEPDEGLIRRLQGRYQEIDNWIDELERIRDTT